MRTYSSLLAAAQACTTREEAQQLVSVEVDALLVENPQLVREELRTVIVSNIGYMTGYVDRAEAGRILALFDARHPYFGAIEEWPATAEETIALGYKIGLRARRQAEVSRG